MSKINIKVQYNEQTFEGGKAARMTPLQALRRSVLSCLLWEKEFYEDGQGIAERIVELSAKVSPSELSDLAIEARHEAHLRHVPLLLLCQLVKHPGPWGKMTKRSLISDAITKVISRADELSEFLALYWKDGKKPLTAQMKKGLAAAFLKFDEYSLAKYNRDGAVKLRDVLFLSHAKPDSEARDVLWKKLKDNQLTPPDTWEVQLSAGADKKLTFERLIAEGKLGYLALLRNLRNMEQAGCDPFFVSAAILARRNGAEKVLPFRFIAAARAAPRYEPALDQALCQNIAALPRLKDRTVVLVDVSNSMDEKLSAKSDLTRLDAACALASIVNAESLRVFSFSSKTERVVEPVQTRWGIGYHHRHSMNVVEVPPRRGMAGADAIIQSQPRGGTFLFSSVDWINRNVPYDRLIVITDEQAFGTAAVRGGDGDPVKALPSPKGLGYMINVASAKNGVGYHQWTHIDGFSENVLRYIVEMEEAEVGLA